MIWHDFHASVQKSVSRLTCKSSHMVASGDECLLLDFGHIWECMWSIVVQLSFVFLLTCKRFYIELSLLSPRSSARSSLVAGSAWLASGSARQSAVTLFHTIISRTQEADWKTAAACCKQAAAGYDSRLCRTELLHSRWWQSFYLDVGNF